MASEIRQAVAEALRGQNLWHGRHGSSPAGSATAAALLAALAERGYRVVRDGNGTHESGEAHRYGPLVCEVCGQRGQVYVAIVPERHEVRE